MNGRSGLTAGTLLPFVKTMQDHDETQKEVDEVLELFRYLPAKDIFEAFYNKRLARRLLMNMSYSFDLERHVLDMLKKGKRDQEGTHCFNC